MGLLIIIFFGFTAFYEIPKLVKAQRRKELVWFSILSLIGFTLCMLLNAGVKIPSPIKLIMDFLDKIGLYYPE